MAASLGGHAVADAAAPGMTIGCDAFRYRGRRGSGTILKLLLTSRCFRAIATFRLYQATRRRAWMRPIMLIAALLHRWASAAGAMDFPLRTQIGAGLMIAHGWGLVLNQHARIGRNVTLFHGVTIGQGDRIARDGTRQTEYPTIGDDVWIGPYAAILGGVTIGSGARIMAGAIVTFDVPPHTMVAGNPAAVVKDDVVIDVANRVPFPNEEWRAVS